MTPPNRRNAIWKLWQPFWLSCLEWLIGLSLLRAFVFTSWHYWTGAFPACITTGCLVTLSFVLWTRHHGPWKGFA